MVNSVLVNERKYALENPDSVQQRHEDYKTLIERYCEAKGMPAPEIEDLYVSDEEEEEATKETSLELKTKKVKAGKGGKGAKGVSTNI